MAYSSNTRGNGGLVEYHNYVSASLGAPLPRAVGSLFPGASSYRAVPRGDESYPLPPPGFLHTSELSLGCKLGWSNDKKRAAFPHSFDPSPRSSLNYHNDTTTSDAVSEHDAATSLVDWMLSDASMSSCRDEFAFKQQLAQRLETGGCVWCVCVYSFIHSSIRLFDWCVRGDGRAELCVCMFGVWTRRRSHTPRTSSLSLPISHHPPPSSPPLTVSLVRVAKPGITMGAHPSQEEQMVAIEKCRHIATAGTGRGSWEGFKQTMQSIERGAIAAADAGGAVAFRRPDPRHELLSMLAQPVGLDRFV
jgi:hypothetical protein